MKYIMLVDVEGATGITTYEQAEGTEFGIDMLMNDISAVLDGVLSVPGNEVLIFDEHTDGRNVRIMDLPKEVDVVCGKPLVQGKWCGIDSSFDGVIMVGFHARAGATGALLPHTYIPWNKNISINGTIVGEIGMEAALAGDNGVPLVMVTGDSAGVSEAEALLKGIKTVVVKEAIDEFQAKCYSTAKTQELLRKAGKEIGQTIPHVAPLTFAGPIEVRVELEDNEYRNCLKSYYPECFVDEANVVLRGDTVTQVWTQYLKYERRVLNELKL